MCRSSGWFLSRVCEINAIVAGGPHKPAGRQRYEQVDGDQIAAPQPSWLLQQPVEPFKAGSLPAFRCALGDSSQDVKGAADAVQYRDAQTGPTPTEEVFLLRRRHPQKQHVGATVTYFGRNFTRLSIREVAIATARDLES